MAEEIRRREPVEETGLPEISGVDLTDGGDYKFVMIVIRKKYVFLRVGNSREKHTRIYEQSLPELEQVDDPIEVGGGRLKISPEQKRIVVYGDSHDLGKEPREITVEILWRNFPHWEVVEG